MAMGGQAAKRRLVELTSRTVASSYPLSPFEQALPGKLHPTAGPAKVTVSHHPYIPLLFLGSIWEKQLPLQSLLVTGIQIGHRLLTPMPESPFRVGGFLWSKFRDTE